jgi:putative addiction module component (TIGR02574 family)
MTTTAAQLLKQAMDLPEEERAELVDALLESLPLPERYLGEQLAVVSRRMENVKEGRSRLIPAEEPHRSVRKALATRRSS